MRPFCLLIVGLLAAYLAPASSFRGTTARRAWVKPLRLAAGPPQKEEDEDEVFSTKSKSSQLLSYYSGLVTDPITELQVNGEELSKRDNLTPNLRFAGIWVVILTVLVWAVVDSNKSTPPFIPPQ